MNKVIFDWSREFVKYTLASAIALIVDYASYILLVKSIGMSLPSAAVAGYTIGLILAYFLISKKVLSNSRYKEQKRQFVLFLVSGALGVGLTYSSSAIAIALWGNVLHIAKLAAVTVSFFGVYLFRKLVVFPPKSLNCECSSNK